MGRTRWILGGAPIGMLAGCSAYSQFPPSGAATASSSTRILQLASAPAGPPGSGSVSSTVPPPSRASTTGGPTTMSQFTSTPVNGLPQCSEYSVTVTINDEPQLLNGEACRQPDGSWHIAEQPVGAGVIYQTVYWPPLGADDSDDDSCTDYPCSCLCFWAFAFGFSVGFPVFTDAHHHFRRFFATGRFGHFGHFGYDDGFHRGGFGEAERFIPFHQSGGFHGGEFGYTEPLNHLEHIDQSGDDSDFRRGGISGAGRVDHFMYDDGAEGRFRVGGLPAQTHELRALQITSASDCGQQLPARSQLAGRLRRFGVGELRLVV
jgi:hypothetical protein